MNRRHLLKTSALITTVGWAPQAALARQIPGATPQPATLPEDRPVDTRARELIARLSDQSPLAILESLEMTEVTEPALTDAGADSPVMAKPWNDPLDTDLEHALGGVLVVTSDDPVNSPDLVTLGAYIVFESPEIAFAILSRQLESMEGPVSMSVAGTKAWVMSSDDIEVAIARLGYVLVIAGGPMNAPDIAEGLFEHLDTVSQAIG